MPEITTDYRQMADDRFVWPGGYELFFITDDGGILCSPCVVTEWAEIQDADAGNGWNVVAVSHDGEINEPVNCDHCYRQVGA